MYVYWNTNEYYYEVIQKTQLVHFRSTYDAIFLGYITEFRTAGMEKTH